jgi:hypothetical protein
MHIGNLFYGGCSLNLRHVLSEDKKNIREGTILLQDPHIALAEAMPRSISLNTDPVIMIVRADSKDWSMSLTIDEENPYESPSLEFKCHREIKLNEEITILTGREELLLLPRYTIACGDAYTIAKSFEWYEEIVKEFCPKYQVVGLKDTVAKALHTTPVPVSIISADSPSIHLDFPRSYQI